VRSLAHQVEEALLDIGDGAPERLPSYFVIGDVDRIDQALQIPCILSDKVRDDAAQEDGDIVLDVLGQDYAIRAIRRPRANEVAASGLE
jgi:hypothetical protein